MNEALKTQLVDAILEDIKYYNETQGNFYVEVELGDNVVVVDGKYEIETRNHYYGYDSEPEEEIVSVWVNIETVSAYDEAGKDIEIPVDYVAIEAEVEEALAA